MAADQRLGWISPEILIEDALTAEYDAMYAALGDDTQIDALLERAFWGASAERRLGYRTLLRGSRRVKIFENFPREESQFPCHAVIIAGGHSQEVLGNRGGSVTFPDGSVGSVAVEIWEGRVGVMTYAENPDELRLYHQLAKLFIAARRLPLSEHFEHGLSMAEQDLGFDPRLEPRFVYHRLLDITVGYEQINAAPPVPAAIVIVGTDPLTQEDASA